VGVSRGHGLAAIGGDRWIVPAISEAADVSPKVTRSHVTFL
jgi:hypothetical protein